LASRVRRVDPDPWTKSRLCGKTTRYLVEGEVSDVRGRERYERGEGEKAGDRNGYRPRQREDGGRRGGIFGAASSRTRMASPSFGGKDRPAAIDYMLTRWPTPKCSKRLPTRTSSKATPRCENGWVRTSIRTPSTPSRSKPTSPLSANAARGKLPRRSRDPPDTRPSPEGYSECETDCLAEPQLWVESTPRRPSRSAL
jgi:hypothetical protein